MNAFSPARDARFIDSGFLGRFLLRLSVLFAAGVLLLFLVFYVIFTGPLPDTYSGMFFALRNMSAYYLMPVIGVSVLAFSVVVGVAVVFLCGRVLHKIAGPLYHLERVIDEFGSGEPVKAVFLRQGDQLEPLAAAYNAFIGRLREDRQRWTALMEHAERLCLQDPEVCRAEMANALAELSILVAKYR